MQFNHVKLEKEVPKLQQINENGTRYYVTPEGSKYPSITTVLSAYNQKAIFDWRKRVGEEEANRISTRASNRGTQMHLICEKYLQNDEKFWGKAPPLARDMFSSIQKYVDMVEEVYGNEVALYSHELKTAGRIDVFCKMGGKPVILDFKTSSRHKSEKDIKNYFLQTTAYAIMIKELTGIVIPKVVVLIAVEDQTPQYFIKNVKDYEEEVRQVFKNYHR